MHSSRRDVTEEEIMLHHMSDLLLDISGPEESDNQRVNSNLPTTSLVKLYSLVGECAV
jgi:hypothetical protein